MAVLVAAWGARLTFNFARKGGFRAGGEDYRYGWGSVS
jgi:steroid 5-alpha reductase family enzyme